MKVAVHAVGKLKAGSETDLAARYLDRFARTGSGLGLDFAGVTETPESRAADVLARRREEADKLLDFAGDPRCIILLDERGRNLTSVQFAGVLGAMRDGGLKTAVLAIGGPDGHEEQLRSSAALVWSFGALTWPHQLVRILVAEQLYRAATILAGHPYHRQ